MRPAEHRLEIPQKGRCHPRGWGWGLELTGSGKPIK